MSAVCIDDFTMLSVIGKGNFAKVILAKKKDTQRVYAIKIIKSSKLQKQQQQVLLQRQVLVECCHPFIIKLHYSFRSQTKLYFALEYCPGGQLFRLLDKFNILKQDAARFYAAQVLLALQYMHSKGFLYRDLKPENVIIDSQGYIRLTDFGLSKYKDAATSVCGTTQYLAPQMLLKQPYGFAIDWWCLGSFIYQMVTGRTPFSDDNKKALLQKIKNDPIKVPSKLSSSLANLLFGLLDKNPATRLGSKGAQSVKTHPWFSKIDFNRLLAKQLCPPFLPQLKSEVDVVYFSEQFTMCEMQSYTEEGFSAEPSKVEGYAGFSFEKEEGQKMQLQQDYQVID